MNDSNQVKKKSELQKKKKKKKKETKWTVFKLKKIAGE